MLVHYAEALGFVWRLSSAESWNRPTTAISLNPEADVTDGSWMSDSWTKERGVGESGRNDSDSKKGMDRFEIPPGATVELLTQLVPGSYVRVTDGIPNPRNSHRGLSAKELSGVQPWALYSHEEVEETDAPVWVQGNAIGNRYLGNRIPVAYTYGRKPRWLNPGSNQSMGHWVLMSQPPSR